MSVRSEAAQLNATMIGTNLERAFTATSLHDQKSATELQYTMRSPRSTQSCTFSSKLEILMSRFSFVRLSEPIYHFPVQ